MRILMLAFLYLLTCAIHSNGQPIYNDTKLSKKYAKDTANFVAYPEVFLLENISSAKKYEKMEINGWGSFYRTQGDKRSRYQYFNRYRYPSYIGNENDTAVLTKCELLECFNACSCPDAFPWYISAQTSTGHLILTMNNKYNLKTFIGKINNEYDAYLWLQLFDGHLDIPIKTAKEFKFKKVKNGFLISYNRLLENSPVTTADMVYFVGNDFKVLSVSKKNVYVNKGMSI